MINQIQDIKNHKKKGRRTLKSFSQKQVNSLISKQYFHMVAPFSQQYFKAKQLSYQASKKNKYRKQLDKQNTPLYQFQKPKAGYYALKGCKAIKPKAVENEHNKLQSNDALHNFIRKFISRKQKSMNFQQYEHSFPNILSDKNNDTGRLNQPKIHSKSVFLDIASHHNNNNKKLFTKLKTQNDSENSRAQIKLVKNSLPIHICIQKIKSHKTFTRASKSKNKETV